jgi:pimeloyl-ACP methyl ester carboxylesterase/nitroreductase
MPYAVRDTEHGPLRLYYDTFGDPTHPALLFVNGLGSQCINYPDAWMAMFVARGLFVIRFDNRDVGLSDDGPDGYTLSDMAADALGVLDHLGIERAHVVGLSLGGMIVQTLAIEHPQRLITMTSVMSTTGEAEYGHSAPEARDALLSPPATDRESAIAAHVRGLRIWGSPEYADEDRWRADAERLFDRAFRPAGPARQLQAAIATGSRADGLRALNLPALVIHGTADTLISPTGGQRTAELIPRARLVLIDGMGHDYPPQLWQRWVEEIAGFALEHTPRPGTELDAFADLVRRRRTSMLVDRDRPVPRELLAGLCELAQWAPNHKRTWPWRFAVVEGDARGELGDLLADAMAAHGDPPEKVAKTRGKYLRTPTTLIVGSAPGDSPLRTAENRDATAAGIQNVLLGATAAGLATYWGSCPKGANDPLVEWCGWEDGTHVAALIYLGWASSRAAAPARPPAPITWRT